MSFKKQMSVTFNAIIWLSRFYLMGLFWHVPLSYGVCITDNLLSLLDYRPTLIGYCKSQRTAKLESCTLSNEIVKEQNPNARKSKSHMFKVSSQEMISSQMTLSIWHCYLIQPSDAIYMKFYLEISCSLGISKSFLPLHWCFN